MAKSKRLPPTAPDTSQITTISPSGEMREATPEEAQAFAERMRAASAERARRDGIDYASEPDDPRMEEAAETSRARPARKAVARRTTPETPPNTPKEPDNSASATKARVRKAKSASSSASSSTSSVDTPQPNGMRLTDAIALARSKAAREILQAAGSRAMQRDGETEPSVGVVLLIQGAFATGQRMAQHVQSTPRWLVNQVEEQGASPQAILSFRGAPGNDFAAGKVVLRPAADTAIRMAVRLAQASVGRDRFDARHLVVAALDTPDARTARQMRQDFGAAGVDLDKLRTGLIGKIIDAPENNEDVGLWQRLLDEPAEVWATLSQTASVTLSLPRTSTVASVNTDRTAIGGPDPLGINADVTAFARLICLEEARPPLSLGIFGEWGSGKSSFMERLQLEIADLTRKEREVRAKASQANAATSPSTAQIATPEATQATPPRFIENAVQIRFNAWHYADANLWASLTAEFFDQLRRGGYEGQRSRDYLALIGKVAERVRSLEASAQKAEDKLADAERAARHADEALASARKKLAASDLALASAHLAGTLDGIRTEKDNAAKLKEVGRRIYRDDLGTDLDSFTAAVSEASTIPGKITLVARVMAGGGLPTWLGAFAIVLIAAAGIGWRLGDPTSLAVLLQRAIAWGGGTLAALGSLWQAVKLAKPVLDGAWEYAKAVEKARKELAKEVEDKEVAARDALRALAEARQKAREAKAPLAKYGDGATAGAPSTILRYFLFEDGDVRDYDKQVGLVSRARRSFEQLDAIFTANRDGLAAKDKQARGEPLTPSETEALTRHEKMQLDKQGLVIPDRIVLYIDDLDRCTHQQVYDVLQAIHLLLAFELFVVVVGVDVRWVEEAVARQFTVAAEDLPDNATPEQRDAARHKAETERRKRAIDYLEKIFQLPFWLRRLSTEGDKGGSYGAYVQELLRANLDVPENVSSPLAGTSGGPVLKTFATGATSEPETSPTDGIALEGLADTAPAADELASVELALATVRLTKAEVDFLASPEIGAIAFKSPRSVKRMLNVYRIVRARMSEAELDEFLGRNGKIATWPLAAFFAAVETGQSVEIADLLYDGLRAAPPHEIFTAISQEAIVGKDKRSAMLWIAQADQLTGGDLSGGIYALNTRRGHPEMNAYWVKCGEALAVARIVRRYSFNRYH